MCGSEYYPEGFSGERCKGKVCPEKNKVCMSCKTGGIKECGEKKTGFVCIKAVFGGNINWTKGNYPQKVLLLGMCNYIQSSAGQKINSKKIASQLAVDLKATLTKTGTGDAGQATYLYAGGKDDMKKLTDGCAGSGGLRGVILGVIYKDTVTSLKAAAAGAAIGGAVGFFIPLPGTTLAVGGAGAAVGAQTIDDSLIVTKNNCGNPDKYFGYADGTMLSYDSTDMKTAAYCGLRVLPGAGLVERPDLFNPSNYWSAAELQKAMGEEGPSITCDFSLTDKNAVSDPGTKFMFGCKAGWCPHTDPKCND